MLLEFDLAGAEWVVVAYLCRDPAMLDVVRSGKSPHVVTAMRMFNLSQDIVEADEKLVGKTIDQDMIAQLRREKLPAALAATFVPRKFSFRQTAKKANHGLNYDETYLMFALQNDLENAEARRIVDLYKMKVYPGVPDWHKAIRQQLEKNRILINCFGRKCYFMGALDKDTFKGAYSFLPQSTVFDIGARAMPKLMEDESRDFRPAQLLAQVHDSFPFQYLSNDIHAAARFAIKMGLDYMSPTLDYGEPFKLRVTLKASRVSWGRMQEVEGGVIPDEALMAERIAAALEKSEPLKKAA